MKTINVKYSEKGKILMVDDTSVYFEQENNSLQIDAEISTNKNVRAYIKAPNGNSTIIPGPDSEDTFIQPKYGVYSVVIKDTYMAKGTLYVGFEVFDNNGYIERFEPLKVYVDSFVNTGEGNTDNVYVVTVDVVETVTLDADKGETARVENVGNKKDMRLKFYIPKGDTGEKGDKGDTGTVEVGTVETLAPEEKAYVRKRGNEEAVFDFGIPRGETGPQGPQGITGDTATVVVGRVTTLAPGEQAYVRNVGSIHDAVFEIGIPEGQKGDTGGKGEKGDTGEPGYTPVAGKDFYTPDEKVALVNEVISSLPVDDRANHESPNFISNGAITAFVLERFSEIVNNYDQNYNPQSMFPQSGKAVDQAIAQLLGSAPENLDTLEELAKALQNDESFANKIIDMISGKVDKVDGYGLSKNDFTDEDKRNLEFHDNVAREYLETKANIREHFMYDTYFNITEDDLAEVESISRLSKYVDELGDYVPYTAKLKDTKAREMILDLEDRKANVFSMSAEGSIINITDSANAQLKGLKIFGKTTQEGEPSIENPQPLVNVGDNGSVGVSVHGKNLLDISTAEGIGQTDIISVKDNTITMEPGILYGIRFIGSESVLQKGVTYTLSVGNVSAHDDSYYGFKVSFADGTVETNYTGGILTFTVSDVEVTGIRYYVGYPYNTDKAVTLSNFQLEVGEVATEYEPYKEVQTFTLNTPNGLPGIPVTSGGNYTDADGQQWVCDEIDFGRGIYVQNIINVVINGKQGVERGLITEEHQCFYVYLTGVKKGSKGLSDKLINKPVYGVSDTGFSVSEQSVLIISLRISDLLSYGWIADDTTTYAESAKAWLGDNPINFYLQRATPIETPLTDEEIAAYKELKTYKPVTNIYSDDGAGIEVEYVADTKNYIDNKFAELQNAIISTL